MLSQKARYALNAALYLARKNDSASITAIAADREIPRKFLEQIMLQMKAAGLVRSRRGPTGGYYLASAPETITFAAVLRCIDGPLALAPCASFTAYEPCSSCKSVTSCEIRPMLLAVRDTTVLLLEGISLAAAVAEPPSMLSEEKRAGGSA